MLEVIVLPVGQLATNCYLVIDRESLRSLIIDPGDDADYIERIIADKKCIPQEIVATHGHFDHILATAELKLAYKITFKIHKNDEFLVKNMQSSARHFLGLNVDSPPGVDGYLYPTKELKIGKNTLIIMETPGHTPGSICLYYKKDRILFTGDLIFAEGGRGRTDFSYSNNEDLNKSLLKIFQLPADTTIYPGHGQQFLIASEKKFHLLQS
jgi:glyoxylase-like metal-dependent hydrolase (beta-lactamase superfamily II)